MIETGDAVSAEVQVESPVALKQFLGQPDDQLVLLVLLLNSPFLPPLLSYGLPFLRFDGSQLSLLSPLRLLLLTVGGAEFLNELVALGHFDLPLVVAAIDVLPIILEGNGADGAVEIVFGVEDGRLSIVIAFTLGSDSHL